MKLNSIIQSKKGDMFQVIIVLILLLIIAIVGFITLTVTTRVNTFWDDSGLLNETAVGTQAIDQMQDSAPKVTDWAILLLFLGMNIGVVISAVRTNFTPVTIVLFIFLTLIAIMFAAGIVNIYQGLSQSTGVEDIHSSLPLTNFLFSKYLPLIICVISAFVMILMYGKGGGDIIS